MHGPQIEPSGIPSPNGRPQPAQAGSPGMSSVDQQLAHKPVCATIPAPHKGQRGGNTRSTIGARASDRSIEAMLADPRLPTSRSEEHTTDLQSQMRTPSAD